MIATRATLPAGPNSSPSLPNPILQHVNLYIIAFVCILAVIIVTTAVTTARVYVLRRRLLRRFEAAVAAGIITPEQIEALTKGRTEPEPKQPELFEVNIDGEAQSEGEKVLTQDSWKEIMVSSALKVLSE